MLTNITHSRASFYCGTFTKGDARIEAVLSAIESIVGRRLTHYFQHRHGSPKAISGDRTAFVSQWLPGPNEKFGSQLLCSKTTNEHVLLVSLDNIVSLRELVGKKGEPFNGAVHITFSESAPFKSRLIKRFAELVTATDCFHACLKLFPFERQRNLTRQSLATRLKDIEKLRAQSEDLWEVNRKLVMSDADRCIYDLDEKPLTGATPDGRAFALKLDWLNYWNDATAERMRFPDKALDRPLEGLYERLPGGWLLKLTPEPTDLDKPMDRERLQWAYSRFSQDPSR